MKRSALSPSAQARKAAPKGRVGRLQALLERERLGAALLTDPLDVRYYTGYQPTATAFLVVSLHDARLFAYQVDNAAAGSFPTTFLHSLKGLKLPQGRIGFDQSTLTAGQYLALRKPRRLIPAYKTLSEPRQVKEPAELDAMRSALRLALRAHRATPLRGTELSVASAFDARLRSAGAEPSFDTIVGAGSNSGDIHHHPSARPVRANELAVFDFGARLRGYCSDTTRTRYDPRDRFQRELFETVSQMQGALIDFITPGIAWKAVQDEWTRLMKRKKLVPMHGFGHGIGLAVHEPLPTLIPGSVVTVEPGIYTKRGGCRIEDMVLITKHGARVLR